jgi:hypothetical protein
MKKPPLALTISSEKPAKRARIHRARLCALTILASLWPVLTGAQAIPPPAKKARRVQITQGPELESAQGTSAIIRWTSSNPGGTDEHYAFLQYGTDADHLTQSAKSHIRLNRTHSYTVFRVRVNSLKPGTTYYYKADSMEANGTLDGANSPAVCHFATPANP